MFFRFLATGCNFEELKTDFLLGSRTASALVKETCEAIWEVYQPLEMKPPSSKERWIEIAENFHKYTNFPNCVGAVDGKHIRLISPLHSGSAFYNYKHYYSIVLMAVVDSDYRFIAVDVGAYGRDSDSNIFNNWVFGQKLKENRLNLPEPKPLPGNNGPPLPYVFLGDEAFPLNNNFLKPYPRCNLNNQRRIFNYRLSRSRRIVECAFGILSNKWRIFHTNMTIPPDYAVLVTKTACVLHNFVRKRDGYDFKDTLTHYFEDVPFNSRLQSTNRGRTVRDNFAEYFMTRPGELSYQYRARIINPQ